jgi:cell division protein FtsQ
MAQRRVSVRKILQTLVTIVAVSGCAVAMISADRVQSARKISAVDIRVECPSGVHFVTEDAIRERLFRSRHLKPDVIRSGKLDERRMEAILDANPWVEEAEVYMDANRVLRIHVTQRVPAVRVFEESGNSYYLDAGLKSMPLSTQYTHYTPVVTGVPRLRDDSAGRVMKGTILGLVNRVSGKTFWASQVSQIDMRADGGFEIVPIIGDQRIIIGDTDLLDDKLANLMAFYQQVQNRVGWDRYRTIDLRYKDQVVASPALSWKAPVDRAISTMNWLTAIMDNTSTKDNAGGDAAAFGDSMDHPSSPVPAARPVDPAPRPAVAVTPPVPIKPVIKPRDLPVKPKPAPSKSAAGKPSGNATAARNAENRTDNAQQPKYLLKPAAAAPKGPKTASKPAPKPGRKDAKKPPVKNTSRQPQNSPSHAATNR